MTRDRLLIEASALFAQKGYNGVSIREIAGKAGIKESSLYNHFASKQALFDAVLSMYEQKIQKTISEFQDYPLHIRLQKDDQAKIALAIDAAIRIASYFKTAGDPLSLKRLIGNNPDTEDSFTHYFHREPLRLIESVLKEAVTNTVDLEILSLIIFGSIAELIGSKSLIEAEDSLKALIDVIRRLLS
ncbi:MAG: TetR/AcrR family transcriptional regulator [Candidatus Izemoplasmatales bacterium]|jgi:AcrR family transcriptional regulator|nr:TetR/AcrR family transcriptional regulator [Candidatus Izemoplasmatales bacterium]